MSPVRLPNGVLIGAQSRLWLCQEAATMDKDVADGVAASIEKSNTNNQSKM